MGEFGPSPLYSAFEVFLEYLDLLKKLDLRCYERSVEMNNQSLKNKQVKKACPECGQPLVIRENRETGSLFLGCTGYPDYCKHTEPLPQDILMEAAGAARLPGF